MCVSYVFLHTKPRPFFKRSLNSSSAYHSSPTHVMKRLFVNSSVPPLLSPQKHTHTQTHTRTHARMHARTHTQTHTQRDTNTHTHTDTHTHTHTHTYILHILNKQCTNSQLLLCVFCSRMWCHPCRTASLFATSSTLRWRWRQGGWSRTSDCICCRRISLCHTYARQKEPDPSSIHHPHTSNIKAVDKTNVVQWQKMTTMNMMFFFSFPDD